jgi:hypothetical protein
MSTPTIITRTATLAGTIATRRRPTAIILIAIVIMLGLMLTQPHLPAISSRQPTANLSNGAPMTHLTGSVYEPGQGVTRKVAIPSGAPMTHLTGSVYDGRDYDRQAVVAAPWSPGGHLTGSVHDGRAYGQAAATHSTGAPMTHLTGSVYEQR